MASRQNLNKEKTSIFFNKNTKVDVKRQIIKNFGLQATWSFEKISRSTGNGWTIKDADVQERKR